MFGSSWLLTCVCGCFPAGGRYAAIIAERDHTGPLLAPVRRSACGCLRIVFVFLFVDVHSLGHTMDQTDREDDLLSWRREFPILEKTVYLISNSLGAMPRAVYDSMREYADTWAGRGV